MNVKLVDGSEKQFEGCTAAELAKAISGRLYKAALAAEVNGAIVGLQQPLNDGDTVRILSFEDDRGRDTLRHSTSHVMASAVKHLFKDVRFGIGPAIDNGFYYDFDLEHRLSEEDFEKIEKKMQEIASRDLPIERYELPREQALQWARESGEVYKEELINDLPEDATISFYKHGDFTDLCAGPHLSSTGKVKHFKLMSVAGAYWRGDEKRPMLQRIYATVFYDKKELEEYIRRMEEAKKRDHRRLGRELDLFSLHDEGPGFPFFHPKGMVLKNQLLDFWRREHTNAGYKEISTPIALSADLWKKSGHWDHYKDNMYFLKIDDSDFAVKPMNCPGAMLMFGRKAYSYRDLPERIAEVGLVHRHELSGALHGLMRVRCFHQDDAHLFMTPEQIQDEIVGILDLTERIYGVFGFNFNVEVSTRPENSMGTEEQWELATDALINALKAKGWDYTINEGDGAFYGPKIDMHLEDCIGRTWQCGTVQLDYQMPERFELVYDGADGEKHRPVMVHRTILGSVERFIGILTEHFGGAFPTWLAPVQVKIMSITDRVDDAVADIAAKLLKRGVRVETDIRNEKIGYKIRQAQVEKVPFMLTVGDREAQSGEVNVRRHGESKASGNMKVDEFIEMVLEEIETKTLNSAK